MLQEGPFFATFAVSFASFAVKDLDRKVRKEIPPRPQSVKSRIA
jgi:hypothetical protein